MYGEHLQITWKSFQLEQANSKEGSDSKVWEQADLTQTRSLLAAVAGEAARRQGKEAFQRFHLGLLRARHGGGTRVPLDQESALVGVAEEAGLDVGRLRDDMKSPASLEEIGRSHMEAVEKHGVFGTPTFVFKNGSSVFLKTFIPPEDESVAFFEHFVGLMSNRPYVGEVKRPQPPWPKGSVR